MITTDTAAAAVQCTRARGISQCTGYVAQSADDCGAHAA